MQKWFDHHDGALLHFWMCENMVRKAERQLPGWQQSYPQTGGDVSYL